MDVLNVVSKQFVVITTEARDYVLANRHHESRTTRNKRDKTVFTRWTETRGEFVYFMSRQFRGERVTLSTWYTPLEECDRDTQRRLLVDYFMDGLEVEDLEYDGVLDAILAPAQVTYCDGEYVLYATSGSIRHYCNVNNLLKDLVG